MSIASTRAHSGNLARRIDRRPYDSPVGLKMVVPGWPQFSWGQHQRGLVLVGSFTVALAVALWTWGTGWGWVFFAFAFITQVTSATDVLRRVVPDSSQSNRLIFRRKRPCLIILLSDHLGLV